MNSRIDDIARIAASPIPRRQAFRLMMRILLGGTVATLTVGTASAAVCDAKNCKKLSPVICGPDCCCAQGDTCCGNEHVCCPSTRVCCNGECVASNNDHCGTSCAVCANNEKCVNGKCVPKASQ